MFQKTALWEPSCDQGFARDASEAANPNLWEEMDGLWAPPLGVTGLTVPDISGHGKDGTPNADLWETSPGPVLGFDGSSDGMEIASGVLLGAMEFTIAGWVRKRGATNIDILWEHSANFNNNDGSFVVYFSSGDKMIVLRRATGTTNYNGGEWIIALGTAWHHLAITFNEVALAGLGTRVWVDGVEQTIDTQTHSASTVGKQVPDEPMYFGSRANSSLFLDCQLGLTGAWCRCLAFSEIQKLYLDPSAPVRPRLAVPLSSGAAVGFVPYPHVAGMTGGIAV